MPAGPAGLGCRLACRARTSGLGLRLGLPLGPVGLRPGGLGAAGRGPPGWTCRWDLSGWGLGLGPVGWDLPGWELPGWDLAGPAVLELPCLGTAWLDCGMDLLGWDLPGWTAGGLPGWDLPGWPGGLGLVVGLACHRRTWIVGACLAWGLCAFFLSFKLCGVSKYTTEIHKRT